MIVQDLIVGLLTCAGRFVGLRVSAVTLVLGVLMVVVCFVVLGFYIIDVM